MNERLLAETEQLTESGASSGDAPGAEGRLPTVYPDYWVTVCSACRTASCWHGEFMCQASANASTVDVRASALRVEDREHPSYFSADRVREVCGVVRHAP